MGRFLFSKYHYWAKRHPPPLVSGHLRSIAERLLGAGGYHSSSNFTILFANVIGLKTFASVGVSGFGYHERPLRRWLLLNSYWDNKWPSQGFTGFQGNSNYTKYHINNKRRKTSYQIVPHTLIKN